MAAVQPGHGAADLLSLGQENPPPCSKVPAEGRLRPSGEVVGGVGGGEGTTHVRCWGAYSLTSGAFWEL